MSEVTMNFTIWARNQVWTDWVPSKPWKQANLVTYSSSVLKTIFRESFRHPVLGLGQWMLFFQSLPKISSHFRPKYPKDLKMNDLEPNSKYFETFYQISCKDNKILKMSTRFGDLCLLGAILRYILEGFPPNDFPQNLHSVVSVNVSTIAGDGLSGIHNPLWQRHFHKSRSVKHPPPLFPENAHNLSLHKTLIFWAHE